MIEYEWKLKRADKRVLAVLLIGAANVGGATIWRLGHVRAGRVYVILGRLERIGAVVGVREVLPPTEDRPPRRFYRLTPAGREWAMGTLRLRQEGGGT